MSNKPAPTPEGADVCVCGDYRKQHDDNDRCRVCANSRAPYDGCTKFRLAGESQPPQPTKIQLAERPSHVIVEDGVGCELIDANTLRIFRREQHAGVAQHGRAPDLYSGDTGSNPVASSNTEPNPTGQIRCLDCDLPEGDGGFQLDMVLTREQWLLIHPDDGGVLCANCIVKRAAELPGVINVSARITFAEDYKTDPTNASLWLRA